MKTPQQQHIYAIVCYPYADVASCDISFTTEEHAKFEAAQLNKDNYTPFADKWAVVKVPLPVGTKLDNTNSSKH